MKKLHFEGLRLRESVVGDILEVDITEFLHIFFVNPSWDVVKLPHFGS